MVVRSTGLVLSLHTDVSLFIKLPFLFNNTNNLLMSNRKRLFEETEEEMSKEVKLLTGGRKKTPAAAAKGEEINRVPPLAGGKEQKGPTAAEEEEEEVFEETKKGGSKKTTATTAPKKEVNENEEEEVPTPKRKRIWEHSTELTDEFLVKEMGILSLAESTLKQLKSQGVESVGSLLGLSKEELGNAVGLRLGSVSAIMEFIRQQKGKRLKSEEQSKQKLTIPKINKAAEQLLLSAQQQHPVAAPTLSKCTYTEFWY